MEGWKEGLALGGGIKTPYSILGLPHLGTIVSLCPLSMTHPLEWGLGLLCHTISS